MHEKLEMYGRNADNPKGLGNVTGSFKLSTMISSG